MHDALGSTVRMLLIILRRGEVGNTANVQLIGDATSWGCVCFPQRNVIRTPIQVSF